MLHRPRQCAYVVLATLTLACRAAPQGPAPHSAQPAGKDGDRQHSDNLPPTS